MKKPRLLELRSEPMLGIERALPRFRPMEQSGVG
jgi:hypothetical protein